MRVHLPPSKSVANRALLLASLAKGESWLSGLPPPGELSEDITAMMGALRALGAGMEFADGRLRVRGGAVLAPAGALDAGAAGTVLRFLLPVAALHCESPVRFIGAKRLFKRPMAPLLDALASCGASWRADAAQRGPGDAGAAPQGPGDAGAAQRGPGDAGAALQRPKDAEGAGGLLVPPAERPVRVDLEIDGSLSSQFASGVAMAAAALPGGGALVLAGSVASRGYLSLTRSVLGAFHCPARLSEGSFLVPGGALRPADFEIAGDWSAAAPFFCAAAIMGGRAEVSRLDPADCQADRAVLEILGKCGSSWAWRGGTCIFDGRLDGGLDTDLSGCPDLAPVLAAAAVAAPGPSELRGLGALPHKESDRLAGIVRLVAWAGGRAEERPGPALVIHPRPKGAPRPAAAPHFDPNGDHRMAFAAAVASLINGGGVLDRGCVAKSFPLFWDGWREWPSGAAPHAR